MKNVVIAGTIPRIEEEIYQREDAFFPNADLRETVQKKLLLESFQFHYKNNELYRQFCEKRNIDIEDIADDIRKIPLISSTAFKQKSIRTNSGESTVKTCLSSGTQGSVSKIERDNTTLERFLGSVRNVTDNVYGVEDAIILNLGPSSEEANDIWFSYVMSVSDLIFPTINYVENDVFQIEKFVEDIKRFENQYQNIFVIGAPIMFMELHKYFKQKGISIEFGPKIFVISAGGWKKYEGQAISRERFRDCCKDIFANIYHSRIRDAFNMVELNTIIPECEYGCKHLPLWVDVYTIDLDTFRVATPGKLGLLGFLDSSPISYPGFVMSGDMGKVTHIDDCPCGRSGVCIDIVRRVNTIESRGCALKIEKNTFFNDAR